MSSCVEEHVDQRTTQYSITLSSAPLPDHRIKAEQNAVVLDPGELVYEHRVERDSRGKLSKTVENGALSAEDIRLVARPYGKQALQKGVLYHEGSFLRTDETGAITEHYEVRKETTQPVDPTPSGPAKITDRLNAKLVASPSDEIEVVIAVKGFQDWDIDMLPPRNFVAIQDWTEAKRSRDAQIAARVQVFKDARDKVVSILKTHDADLISESIDTGLLVARVKPDVVDHLKTQDVSMIDLHTFATQNACNGSTSCTLNPTSAWRVGQGRSADRLFVEPFHQAGYDGGQLNFSRQGSGGIVVGVIDHASTTGWEDEFLGFRTSSSSNPAYNRIWRRYNCVGGSCAATSNYSDSGASGTHAMQSLGIIAGNFQNSQAFAHIYNDGCYLPPTSSNGWNAQHCAAWDRAASGMAPWARVAMYASAGAGSANNVAALNRAMVDNVDIVNMSISNKAVPPGTGTDCNFVSPTLWEIAAENAFDDGIFVVNAPRNSPGTSGSTCTLDSPGDMPKVFTVNALASNTSLCRGDYSQCPLATYGAIGGMDAPLSSGSTIAAAISGIDIVAPGAITYTADADENTSADIGSIRRTYKSGTSDAAPHVSGAAAVVKDWFIANGNTWMNSPGRLTAVMLGMADRGRASGQAVVGADPKWGMGRLKLRRWGTSTGGLAGVWGRGNWTHTLNASSSNIKKFPFGAQPLPANASFLKCVMNEAEDMSNKSTVGDIYFKVSISNPVNGQCLSSSSTIFSTMDASYDLKHMVSMTGQNTVGGKCVSYDIYNGGVAGNSIMVNTFCYYSEVQDDEPN